MEEPSKHKADDTFETTNLPKNVTTIFISKKGQRISLEEGPTFYGTSMRPLYREDIFYQSSFNFLQKYKQTERSNQKSVCILYS